MKKTLSLVTVLGLASLLLTGCGTTVEETVDEEMIDETPVTAEAGKTSLDLGELINLIETHFPTSYTYTIYNMDANASEGEGEHEYTTEELGFLTPEYSNIVDREIVSSGIEDGMIYTEVKATLDDQREIMVLYIVDPVSLNFVAANIEDGALSYNYQFAY